MYLLKIQKIIGLTWEIMSLNFDRGEPIKLIDGGSRDGYLLKQTVRNTPQTDLLGVDLI